jgi:hypothetical protein
VAEGIQPIEPGKPSPPPWAQTIFWIWDYVQREWQALVKLPVVVIASLAASGAYYWGSSRNAEKIEVMSERLTFANEQLAAYKDRLQGATPDEAAKQIAALRQKIQVLMPEHPRHLTEEQKKILASKADELKALRQPIIVFAWLIGDSTGYAFDFTKIFTAQQIPTYGINLSSCESDERGVLVGLKKPNEPSPQAIQFTDILKSAGLTVGHTAWRVDPDGSDRFQLVYLS